MSGYVNFNIGMGPEVKEAPFFFSFLFFFGGASVNACQDGLEHFFVHFCLGDVKACQDGWSTFSHVYPFDRGCGV